MKVNNVWGELTDISANKAALLSSKAFFKLKLLAFLDTLILLKYFWIVKINHFLGDLTDAAAKKASLALTYLGNLTDTQHLSCCIVRKRYDSITKCCSIILYSLLGPSRDRALCDTDSWPIWG